MGGNLFKMGEKTRSSPKAALLVLAAAALIGLGVTIVGTVMRREWWATTLLVLTLAAVFAGFVLLAKALRSLVWQLATERKLVAELSTGLRDLREEQASTTRILTVLLSDSAVGVRTEREDARNSVMIQKQRGVK